MKSTLKKVLFSFWTIALLWAWSIWLVNAQSGSTTYTFWSDSTSFWQGDWVSNPSSGTKLDVAAKGNWYQTNWLIPTIKTFINWVLWMLSLIALVICLRGWFQMLTASGDEGKYKKWFTILKQAAIALAVIWLSWLFVTLILYLINHSAQNTSA